jgi:hypothetical protein
VDFEQLPGGEACRVGVIATDGVNTVELDSEPFRVAVKGCVAIILGPADGAALASDEPVWFQGQGFHIEEGRPETEHLGWTSSIDGDLGSDPLFERTLSPGKHVITLTTGAEEPRRPATITVDVLPPRPTT